MWMVRAGSGSYLFDDFNDKSCVAIGWSDVGDLTDRKPEEIDQLVEDEYAPEATQGWIVSARSQLKKFRHEFLVGDEVITYESNLRFYLIGKITGDYKYSEEHVRDHHHFRDVKWEGKVHRDKLSTGSKNILGSVLTIFSIPDSVKDELLNELYNSSSKSEAKKETQSDEDLDALKKDIAERANEFIKDKISSLHWSQLEELVAGLLKGMGYHARLTEKGPDRGADILASPDGLGLEKPRIKAQVKQTKGKISSPDIRSFIGGLRAGDRGLFVATGGFTKDAKYEADRSVIPCTLVDLDLLMDFITNNYEELPPNTRAIIPLKRLYWPE